MGIFALAACSEDVYHDVETQNEEAGSQYQTNSFDDSQSGGIIGGGFNNLAINYYSPWDIWYNRGTDYYDLQPSYVISNGGAIGENYSPYTLEVFAWIGLAYFDGDNDGVFYDISPTQFGNPPLPVANMTANPLAYQNLYINNQEVGNLVRTTNPLIFQPLEGARIEDREHHLPMPYTSGVSLGTPADPRYPSLTPPWAFGPWAGGFDCTGALQPLEELLLRDYGKVFFYEVNVFEAGAFVGTYILHPEIKTLPNGAAKNWHPVMNTGGTTQLQGNLPFGSFNLHYYTNSTLTPTLYDNTTAGFGNKCNSFELVFNALGMHQHTITGSIPKTLTMDFMQDTPTFWQRSALSLIVN